MILLSEHVALLAFDESKGLPYERAGSALPHTLGATLVLDLVAAGRAELGVNTEVAAIGSTPDDPLLAEAWQSIRDDSKVHTLRDWVLKPSRLVKHLPKPVYEHLAASGVLAHDGTTTVLRRDRYRELDERPERDLVASLAAVLDGEQRATGDDVLLLALLPASRITSAVFPDRDHKATEARIHELVASDDQAGDIATGVARGVAAAVAGAVAAAAGGAAGAAI